MDAIDSNVWGLLAMPMGLLVCFGPVLVAWVIAECRSASQEHPKDGR